MLLDAGGRQVQGLRDRLVGAPFGDECQDLALAAAQARQAGVVRAAVEQLGHDLRVEDHRPVGDTVQGVEEVDDVSHPVLEQVAQRPGAGGDEFPGVALLHVLG